MEEITVKLQSKEDFIRIIGSLMHTQASNMVVDEGSSKLIAELLVQSAGIITAEDVKEFYNK